MKRVTYVLTFLFIGFISYASAQGNWVGINATSPTPAEARLVNSNIQESVIQFSLDGYIEVATRTPRGVASLIKLDNGVQIMETGAPDLAKKTVSIIIPDIEEMELTVVSSKYHEFTDVDIAPSKGHFTRNINPDDVPFVYGEPYDEDAFWPGEIASLQDPFIMRDFRGQSIDIYPFQYNPQTQTLRVYTDIEIRVSSTGREGLDQFHRTRDIITLEPEFGRIYNRFFLNMEAAERGYPMLEGEEGSLLIIAYDDFMEPMEEFVNWKRTLGRRAEMVPKSDAGTTPAAIKSFVQNYYDNNDDFAYLLLIGDGPQIPPMTTSSGHSDNAYGYLVGANSFNDIFVGRFSAENVGHVETHVQRVIEYERDLDESDTWLSNGLGIARNEGAGGGHYGEADHVHMNFIRDTLLNFTYDVVHSRYDGPGFSTSAAEITGDIHGGVSIINFCNHGSVTGWSVAGYNITHVNQLTNVGKLPFIWSVACVNGNFVNNFCFAEAWLRATHNGEPTGAVGMLAATINQLWQPPMCGQDEMVSILAEESIEHGPTIKRTFGGVSTNGSMFMIPQYGATGIQTHDTWIMFGDPTMQVRTAAPEPFMANYNPVMFIGTSAFDVTIPDADGATVAITMYDEVEEEVIILGTAIVDGGTATVNFDDPPTVPGELTLAISGFNKVTYINDEIQLIPPDGPYVILDSYEIDDSAGNNDGEADYGEAILLDVTLENVGIEEAVNVHATLHTSNEYVTITDDFAEFGNIDEDSTASLEGAFGLVFADDIPDQQAVLFTMAISDDNEEIWESNFIIRVNAPVLEFTDMYVYDPDGRGATPIHPGQITDLAVEITNDGNATTEDISLTALSSSMWITVLTQDPIELPPLAPGETAEAVITVSTLMTTPPESFEEIHFTAVTGAYEFEGTKEVVIGEAPVYSDGDIPTTHNSNPNTGSSAIDPGVMSVSIPDGATITSVTVEYSMTAQAGGWTADQRSFLRCVSDGGTTEPQVYAGTGNSAGTQDYVRTGLTIANNVVGGGEIEFELHAFRVWGGSGSSTQYNFVANNTWKLIVYYELPGHDVTFFVKNQFDETLEGASVEVFGIVHETDETGHTFFELPAGTFMYNAWADDHRAVYNQFFDVEEGENLIQVELLRVFEAEFNVECVHGNPIQDAVITIDDETHTAGHYNLDDLLPGTYDFHVAAEGYADYEGTFEIVDDHVVVSVAMLPFYQVTFVITDKYGWDVDHATVIIEGDAMEEGQYGAELTPDHYNFTVVADFYYDYTGEFVVADGNVEVEVVLDPDGTDIGDVAANQLEVYPNPASNHISINSSEMITNIIMIDILGQVVYRNSAHQNIFNIDVTQLESGMYFLQVTSASGVHTQKVQISR